MITGLQASAYPEDAPSQKKVYVELLTPIVEKILGTGVEFEVSQRRGFLRGTVLPPVEIDLKQVQLASRFRAEGARLSRAKQHGLGSVYFNPCITLATRCVPTQSSNEYPQDLCNISRVRIEVLKAVATRIQSSQVLAYCVYSGPRPKLSVGPANGHAGRRNSVFYMEAIKRYGFLLEEKLLDRAYDRAQQFFIGNSYRFGV